MSTLASDQAARLWGQACSLIERQLTEKDYQTWILALNASSFDDDTLTLEAPFGLFRDRVKQSFLPTIQEAVVTAARKECRVAVVVGPSGGTVLGRKPGRRAVAGRGRAGIPLAKAPARPKAKAPSREKTFDNFIVGDGNRLAYMGARQLASGEAAEGGNPLFLYGGVGLGKTHLLMAIKQRLQSKGRRVSYYQGEDFTRRMVEAIKSRSMEVFHREFRNTDALLIDDVQFLAGKKRTQQELYHVFNLLHQAGKPLAFASDRPPDELEHVETGLRSRFQGGLLADVSPLDRELRRRILEAKLQETGVRLESHLVERLSMQLQGSVRELEGLVSRLKAATRHQSMPLDNGAVESMITPYVGRRGPVDLDVVIDTVAFTFGIKREEILSRDRSRRVAWPRHVAAYLCRRLTPASLPEIGQALGGRNHTSILRAVRAVEDRMNGDADVSSRMQQLEKMLGVSGTLGKAPMR